METVECTVLCWQRGLNPARVRSGQCSCSTFRPARSDLTNSNFVLDKKYDVRAEVCPTLLCLRQPTQSCFRVSEGVELSKNGNKGAEKMDSVLGFCYCFVIPIMQSENNYYQKKGMTKKQFKTYSEFIEILTNNNAKKVLTATEDRRFIFRFIFLQLEVKDLLCNLFKIKIKYI